MAKYNIPLSGSNKDGGELGDFQNVFKCLKFSGTVNATGISAGAALVADGIPAGFIPMYSIFKNVSTDAGDDMHSGASLLDVEDSQDELCASLSGLAAGSEIISVCEVVNNAAAVASAGEKDILVEDADFKAAAGKTVNWEFYVFGLSSENAGSLGQ